jgi:predicted GIY-YIG superfamily endonuclease
MVVYVLKLNYGKWYVGKTINLSRRLSEHKRGVRSSIAVKRFGFVELYETYEGFETIENCVTLRYMAEYGKNNVFGGIWCSNCSKIKYNKRLREIDDVVNGKDSLFLLKKYNKW